MRKILSLFLACLMCLCFLLPATADGAAPVARNFEFTTYRNVSFGGELSAFDPEGDELSFELTTEPVKGSLELCGDGSFVYTPAEGKKGRDYFGYKAVDSEGNASQEATVIIKILKNEGPVSYTDMAGSADYRNAVRLADCGAFTGKQVCGEFYFEPEQTVTRGEFLTMCLKISGEEILSGVVSTGFTDDGDIPDALKPYVSTAVKCGVTVGCADASGAYFDAQSAITKAEAAVMLDRALRLSDVSCIDAESAIPEFAVQAAANLSACGIVSGAGPYDSVLTRAEAARMLCGAMDLVER